MKKISIITPCYNGEQYLLPYIEGMLSQTHGNVEYIFVNDGSTDKSEEIILSYREQFEAKGWDFIYIKQENAGLPSALNAGFAIFTGDYLTWIDADDILLPQFLERHVTFLESNPQFGFAYAQVYYVNEGAVDKVVRLAQRLIQPGAPDNFIEDIITCINNPAFPFCMVRACAFLHVHPSRQLLTANSDGQEGQSFQALIPLCNAYSCGYIKEVLAKYVVRNSSHSHQYDPFQSYWMRETLEEVIRRLDAPTYKKRYYADLINMRFAYKFEISLWRGKPFLRASFWGRTLYVYLGLKTLILKIRVFR